jgi:integral membrane sensor domain MASE1
VLTILVGVLYFAAAKLGGLTLMAEGTAIVWLPNGILLGFLLRFPKRTAQCLAAAFAAELAADLPGFGLIEAVSFAVINLGEVLLARVLLARWQFRSDFPEMADVFRFLIIAPGGAALAAAVCGGAVYTAFRGGQTSYLEFVRVWWFGDAVGLILATPFVLAVRRTEVVASITRADLVVGGAAVLCLGLLAVTVDGQLAGVHFGPIVLLPFVAYAATRFDMALASAVVTAAAVVVVAMTATGRNPFGHRTVAEAVVHAQEFLSVMGVTAIGLVAAMEQSRRARRHIETANATLETRVVERTRDLEQALKEVRTLSGFLPICAWCRKLRDDRDYWHSLEEYISQHTDATLTHGICPDCAGRLPTAGPAPDDRNPSSNNG